MAERNRDVSPSPRDGWVITTAGENLQIPGGWALLVPGDATLTRRVKQEGPAWTVKEKRGRRTFSLGVWAPSETIERHRKALETERADPAYQKRLEAGRRRSARKQDEYAEEFEAVIRRYLGFDPRYAELGERLAAAIAKHAVPVGSGTVARTKRIPIEQRAEAATIAWLRHQTTGYDSMTIARVKGRRREVRRQLAAQSKKLLGRYRSGDAVPPDQCLLRRALGMSAAEGEGT